MVWVLLLLKESQKVNSVQVHADSSNFAEGVTKEEAYKQVIEQAEALLEGQRNWVSFKFQLYLTLPLLNRPPGLVSSIPPFVSPRETNARTEL